LTVIDIKSAINTYSRSGWPWGGRRYRRPFLSCKRGPTINNTSLWTRCEKSSCCVMHLTSSMLPSYTSFPMALFISWQHLYSRALARCSVLHWPHWHLAISF